LQEKGQEKGQEKAVLIPGNGFEKALEASFYFYLVNSRSVKNEVGIFTKMGVFK
jgi:hypothetical protein